METFWQIFLFIVIGYIVIIRPIYKTIYYYKEYDSLIVSVGPMILQVISLFYLLFSSEDKSSGTFVGGVIVTILIFVGSVIWNAIKVTKEGAEKREFYESIFAQLMLPFSAGLLILGLLLMLCGGNDRKKRR